jgi:hypothetical protein
VRIGRSFTQKPCGSNSMETLLSHVSLRTEIRFLTREGEMRTLFKCKGVEDVGMVVAAEVVIGRCAPFPTMMSAEG